MFIDLSLVCHNNDNACLEMSSWKWSNGKSVQKVQFGVVGKSRTLNVFTVYNQYEKNNYSTYKSFVN